MDLSFSLKHQYDATKMLILPHDFNDKLEIIPIGTKTITDGCYCEETETLIVPHDFNDELEKVQYYISI